MSEFEEKPDKEEKTSPLDTVRNLLGGIGGQLGDLLGNLRESPVVKMILLGVLILIGLIAAAVIFAQVNWGNVAAAMSPATPAPEVNDGRIHLGEGLEDWNPADKPPVVDDQQEQRESGSLSDPLKRILPVARDPFMNKPILPPEVDLFYQGEILFTRSPRSTWTVEDIKPFWNPLYETIMKDLRARNHEDFLKNLEKAQKDWKKGS